MTQEDAPPPVGIAATTTPAADNSTDKSFCFPPGLGDCKYMVNDYTRNNLIVLALVIGFGILMGAYVITFQETANKAARETSDIVIRNVNQSATNVTHAINHMVMLKEQEVKILANVSELLLNDRTENKENLALFLDTFRNQSVSQVDAIHDLKNSTAVDRHNQTEVFVKTLQQSQNLTKFNIEATHERNLILGNLINTVGNLTLAIAANNMTLGGGDNSTTISGNLTPSLLYNSLNRSLQ